MTSALPPDRRIRHTRIGADTLECQQDRERNERQRDMDYDEYAEALQELTPASDSIMQQIARGEKVFG